MTWLCVGLFSSRGIGCTCSMMACEGKGGGGVMQDAGTRGILEVEAERFSDMLCSSQANCKLEGQTTNRCMFALWNLLRPVWEFGEEVDSTRGVAAIVASTNYCILYVSNFKCSNSFAMIRSKHVSSEVATASIAHPLLISHLLQTTDPCLSGTRGNFRILSALLGSNR